ncbi:3-hydroxyacyl-CoA dehydrogenase/enoyl-CoA hydratase family protein [Symbiobacterium thermophilum]|uniref:3-hydroxyacyl-CoA dehydrogenase n=1 Tax=Symbiobacterium thermophilum (strain DSM 24528 / JCM 14929 / IAM 14863 / T) TaxID=292459 RepID=Q67K05_SYMTH|nr:3-hydroxyacyl-CoA dehydrogenase/enoyl-CoA hydratase family protein [Symbiobacterium thermophilum]BAD41995.1 3-hydroxyacyl-CoA dehydrogenase [Symbiobacterium thermophilum IAM 14863]
MPYAIRKAAVLGAGVMGAQIAAHLANVGIPTLLLDIVPRELTPDEAKKGLTLESPAVRNRLAASALQNLQKLKPSPLYSKDVLRLITPGNLEDDLAKVAECDWVVEAVIENLQIKKDLWQRVAAHHRPGMICSSNTSGISIQAMVEGTPESFRRHFLGTHFFNPPRYMKLLEIIPTPDTDPEVVAFMADFGERVLGKGVVMAKDTPNFIGNRIGVYGMMVTLEEMNRLGLTPDEVDALTGKAIGRPKSATFRTLDVVGIDTFCHVADNCRATIPDPEEAKIFVVPEPIREMVKRGWVGQKARQGFFKKEGDQILTLDLETMEYRPRRKASFPSLEAAKANPDLRSRVRGLVFAKDKAGEFLWAITKRTLLYAARKVGEIADDVVAIDNAMKWGYNWELGPFEMWDAIGLPESIARMEAEGEAVPDWVKEAARKGGFYRREAGKSFFINKGEYAPVPVSDRVIDIGALRETGRVVREKKGATLLDMGDGVLLMETHSPKAAIGFDIINMCKVAAEELASGRWKGLVIGARTENFCVGANVAIMLMEAQEEEWDELEFMAREFQNAFMALKLAPKPVVVAPYGMTLGGGYELCAVADRVVAAAESYIGLVEVGVGVIPGAGGNKEMLIRGLEGLPAGAQVDIQPILNRIFETIATAKVATSAREAQEMGYLRKSDVIVVNKDHQLYEAKRVVLALEAAGYRPPEPALIPAAGPEGRAVLELGAYGMFMGGWATEHELFIARKLAYVLTGGNVPAGTLVTEQYLLDLEREAFLSLLGTKKTQERMAHLLKTGKPLRN